MNYVRQAEYLLILTLKPQQSERATMAGGLLGGMQVWVALGCLALHKNEQIFIKTLTGRKQAMTLEPTDEVMRSFRFDNDPDRNEE